MQTQGRKKQFKILDGGMKFSLAGKKDAFPQPFENTANSYIVTTCFPRVRCLISNCKPLRMNSQNFDELTINNKIVLIEDMGELVCSIEFYEHRIFLFSFNSMFVEAYRNIDTDKIEKIQTVTFQELDKFLSRIMLGNLVRQPSIL
jgi:hypothetical protein